MSFIVADLEYLARNATRLSVAELLQNCSIPQLESSVGRATAHRAVTRVMEILGNTADLESLERNAAESGVADLLQKLNREIT